MTALAFNPKHIAKQKKKKKPTHKNPDPLLPFHVRESWRSKSFRTVLPSRDPFRLLYWADTASSSFLLSPTFFFFNVVLFFNVQNTLFCKSFFYKKQQVRWSLASAGNSSATPSYQTPFAEHAPGREAAIPEGTNPDNLNSTVSFVTSNEK